NNFVANVPVTWSLTNKTGGVANGDLVPSGDTKSATFTGHATGTATIHAVDGSFTDDSGTITVTSGTATHVSIETAANGSGVHVGAQSLNSGNSVTVYAIERDRYSNRLTTIPYTWSLTNKTGGVANGDLVPSGDTKSATLPPHATTTSPYTTLFRSFTDDSGTITVTSGTATHVSIETAANGSGVHVGAQSLNSGNSVTVYAIE